MHAGSHVGGRGGRGSPDGSSDRPHARGADEKPLAAAYFASELIDPDYYAATPTPRQWCSVGCWVCGLSCGNRSVPYGLWLICSPG